MSQNHVIRGFFCQDAIKKISSQRAERKATTKGEAKDGCTDAFLGFLNASFGLLAGAIPRGIMVIEEIKVAFPNYLKDAFEVLKDRMSELRCEFKLGRKTY